MADASVQKLASFKRSMSCQVPNPTSDPSALEPEPQVEGAQTPTMAEVDAAFEKALEALQKPDEEST
ncbi:hypothetical protein TSOC_009845 [Tetrabaena socialis]|uniref:Uncharacterized protein n=1 Tax=Tetrabaena socialis TaxID=47790 RepID=A0A2J7ZUT6_9CHLO|nr:hypothetical protein TSOC_009845 [Tetrabaena socialis]|eukprot:PNH04036.1 hypothetical protein TSOC_009845 [Tetrabaena socialis]